MRDAWEGKMKEGKESEEEKEEAGNESQGTNAWRKARGEVRKVYGGIKVMTKWKKS